MQLNRAYIVNIGHNEVLVCHSHGVDHDETKWIFQLAANYPANMDLRVTSIPSRGIMEFDVQNVTNHYRQPAGLITAQMDFKVTVTFEVPMRDVGLVYEATDPEVVFRETLIESLRVVVSNADYRKIIQSDPTVSEEILRRAQAGLDRKNVGIQLLDLTTETGGDPSVK